MIEQNCEIAQIYQKFLVIYTVQRLYFAGL